ncbi:Hypothetical predicted protein [Xyrichtys novacula]|uniref:Uncharacterized protein n=1 Tax=Xyrichtys novacula TaxID=13765 RepID=A0AAV1FUZ8_XYRNO|nr:Hypothetical predicted protein [Xyrichtys novacula]
MASSRKALSIWRNLKADADAFTAEAVTFRATALTVCWADHIQIHRGAVREPTENTGAAFKSKRQRLSRHSLYCDIKYLLHLHTAQLEARSAEIEERD